MASSATPAKAAAASSVAAIPECRPGLLQHLVQRGRSDLGVERAAVLEPQHRAIGDHDAAARRRRPGRPPVDDRRAQARFLGHLPQCFGAALVAAGNRGASQPHDIRRGANGAGERAGARGHGPLDARNSRGLDAVDAVHLGWLPGGDRRPGSCRIRRVLRLELEPRVKQAAPPPAVAVAVEPAEVPISDPRPPTFAFGASAGKPTPGVPAGADWRTEW